MFVTEWNSSALVKAATKTGKKKNALTPMTFSLLHATDFADRLLYNIIPPLKAGMIVLADRYAYTAFARDVARGVDRQWVRELYSFAVKPDLASTSACRSTCRRSIGPGGVKLKFYEAGMDMGWSSASRASGCSKARCSTNTTASSRSSTSASSTRRAASPNSSARTASWYPSTGDQE